MIVIINKKNVVIKKRHSLTELGSCLNVLINDINQMNVLVLTFATK